MTETPLTFDRDRLPPGGFIPMLSVKQPSRVRIRVQYLGVVFPDDTLDVFVGIGQRGSERDVLHFTETGERTIPETVLAGDWISVRYSPLPHGASFTIWPSDVETVP